MSGAHSRRKGRAFEQLVARAYRAALPEYTVRRALQSHRAYESDVVVENLPLWTECCHADRPSPAKKLAQAERDVGVAKGNYLPVVVWRRSGERQIWVSARLPNLESLLGIELSETMHGFCTVTWEHFLMELPRWAGKLDSE